MDLARLLVKRKIARYIDGAWVLPLEFAADELPSRLVELLHERLTTLSPEARALCESLSVHSKRIPIERCLAVSESRDERQIFMALDDLVAEQILLVEDGYYGFRQQALRQSVLEQVGEARRKTLHLRAAQTLLDQVAPSVSSRMEAAWHLLHAGDELRGADIIVAASREFLRHQGVESVEEVVQAMVTALGLLEKHQRSKYEIASMLFPLMSLAFFVDWRIPLEHGERAIDLGLDVTGLGLAQKLSRFLPGKLALGLGLGVAAVRFAWQQLRGLKFNLIEAIESFCGFVPVVTATQNIVFDLPATKRSAELLEPMTLFGKGHIASIMYDFAKSQYLMAYGREGEAADLLEEVMRDFDQPAVRKMLGDGLWKAMLGGIHFSRGIGFTYEFGPRALEVAHEMEQLGVRVWAMAAEEVRMLYHAMRGETEAVRRCRERVELFAVQGSTTWQADIFWPILLMDSEIRAGDSIAVRTIREQLTRRAKDHPSLQAFADVAHATYMALRGEHHAAIASFERMHEKLRQGDPAVTWPAFRASFALAQALNAVGEHARAKRYASESLSRAGADAGRVVGHYLEPKRQLALAEAGLGNHAEAVRMLDDLLAAHGHQDQPLLIGLLHKARAEVALQMKDLAAFEIHFDNMQRRFSGARNPALVAQTDRLAKRAAELRVCEGKVAAPVSHEPLDAVSALTRRALDDIFSASDRPAVALRLILRESKCKAGFLYLLNGDRLELAAASSHTEPARRLEVLLERDLRQAQVRSVEEESLTATADSPTQALAEARSVFIEPAPVGQPASLDPCDEMYRLLVLRAQRNGATVVVGGLIIESDPQRAFAIDRDLLEPIASILCNDTSLSS
jgi:hypothetical protein